MKLSFPPEIPLTEALLDRATSRLRDEGWVNSLHRNPCTCYVPTWRGRCLYSDGEGSAPILLTSDGVRRRGLATAEQLFLGLLDSTAYFTLLLPEENEPQTLAGLGSFVDLRKTALLLPPLACEIATLGKALYHWRVNHRYCGRCGASNTPREGGTLLRCSDPGCGRLHFPRTDAAVIVVVEWEGKCLLGRQESWPPLMYSCLAGFVDAGETIENAVVREVWEETGVRVREVEYLASQPWPFPSSLMLGFRAKAESGELNIDRDEIEDARWFSRADIRRAVREGALAIPSKLSISRWLLEGWYDEGDEGAFGDLADEG